MFGKEPVMTPLEARKRLLLAESEINRELLAQEWQTVSAGARSVTQEIGRFSGLAVSLAALAAASFSVVRKSKPKPAAEKFSWLSLVVKGIRLGFSLWTILGAKRPQPDPS